MAATLRFDIAEAESLIAKGADPVNARESTPFSKGDLLSPLAALMLQGIVSQEALAMAQFLVDNGASLNDWMNLPGSAHFGPQNKGEEAAPRLGTGSGRKTSSEPESRSASPGRPNSASSKGGAEEEVATEHAPELGTMLHYVVALGDHAHLLKILMVAGVQRPALPQCLMHEVELGILIPPKPVAADERTPSRGARKSRSNSLSRRPSRLGRFPPPEGHAPRSALPALTAVPSPADGLRLFCKVPDGSGEADGNSDSPLKERRSAESKEGSENASPVLPSLLTASSDELEAREEERPELIFDFSKKSSSGLDVAEWALEHGDITAARLLTFYGAKIDFQRLVNGSQTALARACSNGDLPLVERLLDAGDTLTQISADGRYTLIHYACAHPPVLEYLSRRGLSLDCENAFGESALISLIRHGFGRNADHAIKETPRMSDAARLAALPYAAVRNYILTPLPPLVGGFGSKSKGGNRGGKNTGREPIGGVEEQRNTIGGHEAGTWWSFSLLPTADMIQHLVDCGANIHGVVPPEECDLRYYVFSEEATRSRMAAASQTAPVHTGKKRSSLPNASVQEEQVTGVDLAALPFTDDAVLGRTPVRMTPLMNAIAAYHPELIRKMLVEYHVDVSRRDSAGACCLHYAAVCPHPSVLENLLSPAVLFNSPALDTNAIDMAGRTPLHYAVAMGQLDTIKILLSQQNILAGKPDVYGLTPLHLAVLANEQKAVELLLGHSDAMLGATSSVALSSSKGSRRQKAGKNNSMASPNPRATASTGTGVEYQMVEVEAEDFVDRCTPLEMAIKRHRHAAIVQLLLSEGHATMQRWSGLEDGGSLLHRAVVDNREDYVRILLDNFADPNEPDNEEFTPLYLAVDQDVPNVELIRSLVNAGAYSYAQSGTNLRTPLHVAAARGNAEVLGLLFHERASRRNQEGGGRRRRHSQDRFEEEEDIENGRDEDFQAGHSHSGGADSHPASPLIPSGFFLTTDSQARTPLHILCAHTRPNKQQRVLPLIQELMKCDASMYMCGVMDAKGRTPLHEACRSNFVEAVQALLSVDPLGVYRVDASGNTPLHDVMYTVTATVPPPFAPENDAVGVFAIGDQSKKRDVADQRSGEGDGEDYSDAERFTRVEEVVSIISDVVLQTVPRQLSGMPLVSNNLHKLSPVLSITTQLKQQKRYRGRWAEGPARMTSDSFGTPCEDLIIRSLQDYFKLTDKHGRTPLLLAGEQGNTVAAKTIMRLASIVQPIPSLS